MPRAIAIETSGRIGSIAVVADNQILAEEQFPHGLQHAAHIVPMIDRLTRGQGWTPRDIEHLYVSVGPGSFTGLRIGVTLAKAMALTTGVKIVAVPSVRVLVENAQEDAQHVNIVLDAKRDQIFTARFERQPSGWMEREPAHLDDLASMLARCPRPAHLIGEGIPYHQKFIPKEQVTSSPPSTGERWSGAGVIITDQTLWRARASVVAMIGTQLARQNHFADPMTLTPIYIRRPEAEEKFEQQHRTG